MNKARMIAAGVAAAWARLAASASQAAHAFQGVWKTHWDGAGGYSPGDRRMVILQATDDPTELDGMWDGTGFNGLLTGHLKGNVWSGQWTVPGDTSGTFSFTYSGGAWSGTWSKGAATAKWYSTGKIASIP